MIIYKITNKYNNKIYIGQTIKTKEERLNRHYIEALSKQRNNKINTYFHNALLFYGIKNFIIEEIDSAETIEELNEKEIFWIDKLQALNHNIGYNLMSGGEKRYKK